VATEKAQGYGYGMQPPEEEQPPERQAPERQAPERQAPAPGYQAQQPPAGEEAYGGAQPPGAEPGLEELLGAMQQAEEERYQRIEGYADLIVQLQAAQDSLAYGEWQIEPTIDASEQVLDAYAQMAWSQNAWLELDQIQGALDHIVALRERLENRDLFIARIELTFVVELLYRARRVAMSATSPAGTMLGGQHPPPEPPPQGKLPLSYE
jgi:hypothetical protein